MRRGAIALASMLVALAACHAHPRAPATGGGSGQGGPVVVADAPVAEPPTVEVFQPARGAYVDGPTLEVRGRATGSHVRVTVAGLDASVAPDGTFALAVPVAPHALAFVETHARDEAGRDARDVRAVLAGPFAVADGRTPAPIAARLERGGLAAIGRALGAQASAIDFTAAARPLNPVFDQGDCLGARVDVDDVEVAKVTVALAPAPRALAAAIALDDVVGTLRVRYTVACLAGEAVVTVKTRARASGELGVTLSDRGAFHTRLANTAVALDDLDLDISHVPGAVERLLRRALRGAVERALAGALEQTVPPLVDAKLAALFAAPLTAPVLGTSLAIAATPDALTLDAGGLALASRATVVVAGGEQARYATHPVTLAPAAGAADLEAWIATDAIDQLLAGLAAAHAFDRTIATSQLGPLAFVLGGKLATLDLRLALPPTLATTADHHLALAVGDLVLVARDATGSELQRFAISVRTELAPRPDGTLSFAAAAPTIFAQELPPPALPGPLAAAPGPLDAAAVETIARTAWTLLAGSLDEAIQHIPLPAVPGSTLELRALPAADGVAAFAAHVRS